MWKAVAAFNDSTDTLNIFETNAPDAKIIHDWLINLISRLELDLKSLKEFASGSAYVMTGVNILNIHCICHRLALACANSSIQLTVLKDFEDVLFQLWAFFKNSPRRLNILLKPLLKCIIWIYYRRTSIKSNKRIKKGW